MPGVGVFLGGLAVWGYCPVVLRSRAVLVGLRGRGEGRGVDSPRRRRKDRLE